ncbi:MAG: IS3 family transposase [Candidatus Micrarchaeaceae archaeon]
MPLKEISRASCISLIRLSPQIENNIIRVASERPTYGYRRVWATLRNDGITVNRKATRVLIEWGLSLPYAKHRGRTKTSNLFHPTGPDQLWEAIITYIQMQIGMIYLTAIMTLQKNGRDISILDHACR